MDMAFPFLKLCKIAYGCILLLSITACQTSDTLNPERKLTVQEVNSAIIGRRWGQGEHTFLFAKGGLFQYSSTAGVAFGGTYVMNENGTICTTNDLTAPTPGQVTCFTFYTNGKAYRYYHNLSGKFWPVNFK